jgi:hypothetical protein
MIFICGGRVHRGFIHCLTSCLAFVCGFCCSPDLVGCPIGYWFGCPWLVPLVVHLVIPLIVLMVRTLVNLLDVSLLISIVASLVSSMDHSRVGLPKNHGGIPTVLDTDEIV